MDFGDRGRAASRTDPGPRRRSWVGKNGVRIAGEVWGDGPPVVLLHGGGQTRHSWKRTCADLASRGHHAIAVDLRGHGESEWAPGQDYSLDAHVADLLAVVGTLREPPVLVGASLGGLTALTAVGERAAGAAALVLVDITPRIEAEGTTRIRAFMTSRPDGFASLEEARDAIAAYLPGRGRPRGTAGLAKNLRRGDDDRYHWHWDPAMLSNRTEDENAAFHARLVHAARGVRVPTLLVRGERSEVVSRAGVREFIDLIPGAEYSEISGAGHMVAGDANDPFTTAIVGFVERVGKTSRPPRR